MFHKGLVDSARFALEACCRCSTTTQARRSSREPLPFAARRDCPGCRLRMRDANPLRDDVARHLSPRRRPRNRPLIPPHLPASSSPMKTPLKRSLPEPMCSRLKTTSSTLELRRALSPGRSRIARDLAACQTRSARKRFRLDPVRPVACPPRRYPLARQARARRREPTWRAVGSISERCALEASCAWRVPQRVERPDGGRAPLLPLPCGTGGVAEADLSTSRFRKSSERYDLDGYVRDVAILDSAAGIPRIRPRRTRLRRRTGPRVGPRRFPRHRHPRKSSHALAAHLANRAALEVHDGLAYVADGAAGLRIVGRAAIPPTGCAQWSGFDPRIRRPLTRRVPFKVARLCLCLGDSGLMSVDASDPNPLASWPPSIPGGAVELAQP